MSINKKIIVATLIGIIFGTSSCKRFLNVNTNPNQAQTASAQSLLPAAQLWMGTALGCDLEIDGSFFAQYWTQSPGASQYQVLDKYTPQQDQFSTPWTNLYLAEENFYQLYNLADSQKLTSYKAIALLMQAYTFQLLTDGWGDVPFSQALKGQYSNGHLINPKYDKQDSVYMGIIALIDTANALLAKDTSTAPVNGDLVYSGDMTRWQKFSNTLALRVYLRLSEVNNSFAQAGIDTLFVHAATNAGFIGTGDDAAISAYGANSATENPLFAEEVGLQYYQNYVATNTCLDSMISNNDPRDSLFYEFVQGTGSNGIPGEFVGLANGEFTGVPYTGYSFPSVYVGADAANVFKTNAYNSGNAPVNLLTSYESLFLQAEVAARGWGGIAGTDGTLYLLAIKANFTYYSAQFANVSLVGNSGATEYNNFLAGGSYWLNYPIGGTVAQKLQYIISQKWFAMCGNQGFEAWCEWRRTGYPNWFTYAVDNASGVNIYPKRFTYPTSESVVNGSFNPSNGGPGLIPITTPVWWDVQSAEQGTADH